MSVLRNNLILKLLIVIFIYYNLDTVYSFTHPTKLRKYYKTTAKQFNKTGNTICEYPKEKWAGVCYQMFKKLKKDNAYKYKLFVSYNPFFDFDELLESKCTKETFFFEPSVEKIGNSKGLMQQMMPCFGRSAVVNPDVHYEDYEYYNEFMTFPASPNSLYVFKRIPNTIDFFLLEICKNINWSDDKIAVPFTLLQLPPPQFVEWNEPDFRRFLIKTDLMRLSSDPGNIINIDNEELRFVIRTTLMKTLENDKLYIYTPEDMKQKRDIQLTDCHLRFFNPDTNQLVSKDINVYSCRTSHQPVLGRLNYTSYDYKIAAGTTPDSVFILKRVHLRHKVKCHNASQNGCQITSKRDCEILAVIKNVYPQHILYII